MEKEVGHASTYQSIEQLVRLPQLIPISNNKKLFPHIEESREEPIKREIIEKGNVLIDQINNSFKIFEKAQHFRFQFPQSLFPEVVPGQRNQITYQQKIITEQQNTFKDKLSEEQIKQISEKGQFKVKSNIEYITLPYVWKINQTLFWGREKIQLIWKQSLSQVFGVYFKSIVALKYLIPRQFQNIKQIPSRIFSLIFGRRKLKIAVDVDYEKQLYKDFWKNILDKYYEQDQKWGSALWNYLFVHFDHLIYQQNLVQRNHKVAYEQKQQEIKARKLKYDNQVIQVRQKQNKILKIDGDFQNEWGKLKKRVFNQINAQFNNLNNSVDNKVESEEQLLVNSQQNNDDKILEALSERKFTHYLTFIQKKLPEEGVPSEVVKAIVIILQLYKLINGRIDKKNKVIARRRLDIENLIRKKYPIKSHYAPYFNRLINQQMKKVESGINDQMHKQLLKIPDFISKLGKKQQKAYQQFLNFKTKHDTLLEAKKNQIKVLHEPNRIFSSDYLLLPPYKVSRYEDNKNYFLKKVSDPLKVTTNTNFWKLKLYWMRVKTWTINIMVFLFYHVWKGPLGLRCLYGIDDFQYSMQIRYDTGEIYYLTRKTVIGHFETVNQGIRQSRQRFESLPDLGLFGKNISRIFNYVECYLFRFLLTGVIITLIGYPILILVTSVVTLILVITFWAWTPLLLIISYLYNILIYQFESDHNRSGFKNYFLPLPSVFLLFLKNILVCLFCIGRLLIFTPIVCFFIGLFAVIQKYFRTVTDGVMLFLFKTLGRTPSRDTGIAKKISGPGMSKQYYMSINEEDVYVLIRSSLEKIYVDKFNYIVQRNIAQNLNKFNATIRAILKPFNLAYYNGNLILDNTNKLLQNYRHQYQNYLNRYPRNPQRVRFTQQQIDNYFQNTVVIVKNFVQRHRIQKWIFNDNQLYEDMYDQLTRTIWIRVFNCGEEIFQPLEKLDTRFKLEDQYSDNQGINYSMKKKVGSIMKALEGQVDLNHHRQRLAPFKHNLLNREIGSEFISEVFNYRRLNSGEAFNLDVSNPKTLFVPNLNINQIILSANEFRRRNIRDNPNIVDN